MEDAAPLGSARGKKGRRYKGVGQKRTEKRREKRTGLKTRHYRRQKKKEGGLPFDCSG